MKILSGIVGMFGVRIHKMKNFHYLISKYSLFYDMADFVLIVIILS